MVRQNSKYATRMQPENLMCQATAKEKFQNLSQKNF